MKVPCSTALHFFRSAAQKGLPLTGFLNKFIGTVLLMSLLIFPAYAINEDYKITASDGAMFDNFGRSVAVSSDRIVVGHPYDHDRGSYSGSIYIYDWDGSQWNETKIKASDAAASDRFGQSVSVSGDRIVVGSYKDDDNGTDSGSIYIYDWDGSQWNETKITASGGAASDWFGESVSVSGDRIVVGSYWDDDNGYSSGSAYIYDWDGSQWNETKITASDGAASDNFGQSVSVSGDRIVIGSPFDEDNGVDGGSVYIYDWNDNQWNETKLTASDGAASDLFGLSVSVSGDRIIAGSLGDDDNGYSSGSAYIYDWDGSQWDETKITASDSAEGDLFGRSVSVSGDRIVVGSYSDDDNGLDSGSAYIYDWEGSQWNETKLTASDGVAISYFGYSVSVSGDRIVVGSHLDNGNGIDSGAAYVFNIDTTHPALVNNEILPVNEGDTGIITTNYLSSSDIETDDNSIVYTLTNLPVNGTLLRNGIGLNLDDIFTQADIIANLVTYSHNDSNTIVDSFNFDLSDLKGNVLPNQTFTINITPIDDDSPIITANQPLTVIEGASGTIILDQLSAADTETDDDIILYKIASLPMYGTLFNYTSPLGINDVFTQHDIFSSFITYTHNGNGTIPDSFYFNVGDTNTNFLLNQTFSINVISDGSSGIGANYINASTIASSITNSDDSSQSVSIGFNFPFYGNTYSALYISTNGYISFGSGYSTYSNQNIPSTSSPNNIIAPFWDDLNPANTGDIFYQTVGLSPNRIFVVEWRNVTHYPSGTDYSFEIQLEESTSTIRFLYGSMNGSYADGSSATIGIENSMGTVAVKHSYNQASSVSSNSVIEFLTSDGGNSYSLSVPSVVPVSLSVPETVKEGDGVLLLMGSASIVSPLPSDLIINLNSSDITELITPVTVTIPAGQASVSFNITIFDDTDSDGSQNVTLTANGAGISGETKIISVLDNDVSHFSWETIDSPFNIVAPISTNITARDPDGDIAQSFNSTVNLEGHLGLFVGTVEVLTFVAYADTNTTSGEYPKMLTAISNHFTDYNEISTTTTDPSTLSVELAGKHVFLIPEQENYLANESVLTNLGTSWSSVLNNFVNNGGIVIVCSYSKDEHRILTESGLMSLTKLTIGSETVSKSLDHTLTEGISSSFYGYYMHKYSTTDGTVVLESASSGQGVVISRDVGSGHVIMLGSDFYTINTDMDRILANTVKWAQTGSESFAITPSDSGTFNNGSWSGQVTISNTSGDISLTADDANGHIGVSNTFLVFLDTDSDGITDDDEIAIFGTNPNNADTDGDSLEDGWEIVRDLDPLSYSDASEVLWHLYYINSAIATEGGADLVIKTQQVGYNLVHEPDLHLTPVLIGPHPEPR